MEIAMKSTLLLTFTLISMALCGVALAENDFGDFKASIPSQPKPPFLQRVNDDNNHFENLRAGGIAHQPTGNSFSGFYVGAQFGLTFADFKTSSTHNEFTGGFLDQNNNKGKLTPDSLLGGIDVGWGYLGTVTK